MKLSTKNKLLLTLAFGTLSLPVFASAQTATSTPATEAQVFTACSQAAIEARDESIGSARAGYNNAMAVALDARKEAEKKAVALADDKEKKDAIKEAVDDYKNAVTQAQETLLKARKEAWSSFETNTKACRDNNGKKAPAEDKTVTANAQAKVEKAEQKPAKSSLLESILNLFR